MEDLRFATHNNHRLATVFHDGGSKKIVIFATAFGVRSSVPGDILCVLLANSQSKACLACGLTSTAAGTLKETSKIPVLTTGLLPRKQLQKVTSNKATKLLCLDKAWVQPPLSPRLHKFPSCLHLSSGFRTLKINPPNPDPSGYDEAAGQIVQSSYWQEAHDAKAAEKLQLIKSPIYIIQCENDQYVTPENQAAIASNAQPQHEVVMLNGFSHGNWPYKEALKIVDHSVDFLVKSFT